MCARLGHDPWSIFSIANDVPWSRLHPQIQTLIDETMQQASDERWTRTWACALGQAPLVPDNDIDASLLLWRIDQERWKALDSKLRDSLVDRSLLPYHCYGWGVHPDPVARWDSPKGKPFRFWNPDVPPDDLRAWAYAYLLQEQTSRQETQEMIALLHVLPSNRRARFEQIIDRRLGGRPEATAQSPWEWTTWNALPAAERLPSLHNRLAVLWNDRDSLPAVRCWRARNDGLTALALMVGEVLGLDDPSPILAALLVQVLVLRGDTTDDGPPLPFPDRLDDALRVQITRLPLARDAQAYAAWCLRVLDQDMGVGSTLIALHPDVAVALAPILTTEERAMVTASPATKGWDSMTVLNWTAVCENKEESIVPPIQRRIS